MTLLSADQILGKHPLPYEDIDIPEWAGTIRIGTITARVRDEYEEKYFADKETVSFRAFWVAATAIDEQGNNLFKPEQMEALSNESSSAIAKLFAVADRLNGITDRTLEALEKN